jgi:hypothetical protein
MSDKQLEVPRDLILRWVSHAHGNRVSSSCLGVVRLCKNVITMRQLKPDAIPATRRVPIFDWRLRVAREIRDNPSWTDAQVSEYTCVPLATVQMVRKSMVASSDRQ